MVASDIVEIDINALGRRLGKAPADRCGLVVDGRVESGLVQEPGGLLGTSGAADDERCTLEAGKLDHQRAASSGCGRDEDAIAFGELTDSEQTGVCGQARHTENAAGG